MLQMSHITPILLLLLQDEQLPEHSVTQQQQQQQQLDPTIKGRLQSTLIYKCSLE